MNAALLYLMYFGIMMLGLALQVAIKMQSYKSRMASIKVIFKPSEYFSDDWLSIVISFIVICLWLLLIPELELHYPALKDWIRLFSAFIGYGGTSLIIWAFSQFDARIKAAGSYKATIAGEATGTGDALTPAVKPIQSPKI